MKKSSSKTVPAVPTPVEPVKEEPKPVVKEEPKPVKETKTKKESKKEKVKPAIIVKYPDEIPELDDCDVLELDKDYYMDKMHNVFMMTDDGDLGAFLGIYDTDNKKIVLMEN
jgi:hypothetical protein